MTTQDALRAIAGDMRDDVGNVNAAVATLAEIVATLIPADEPEREPVPFKDFLPEPVGTMRVGEMAPEESEDESAWYRQAAHEDDDHASCLGDCGAFAAEADRLISKVLGGER